MSYRELWVLIAHLPQESWTQTALRDSPEHAEMRAAARNEPVRFGPWALLNYQLADLRDDVRGVQYALAVGLDGLQAPATPPAPVPRPGAEPERALTPKGLAYLKRLHNGRET